MHALEAQDALHAPAPATPDDVHHLAKGKPGYCAMRGNCGRATMFGAELPCPDDGKADKVSRLTQGGGPSAVALGEFAPRQKAWRSWPSGESTDTPGSIPRPC